MSNSEAAGTSPGDPRRDASPGARFRLRDVVRDRTVWLLAGLFTAAAVFLLVHQHRVHQQIVAATVRADAEAYSHTLTEFRAIYTSEVVDRILASGLPVTHDYAERESGVPLPITLTIQLADRIGQRSPGVQAKLYSPDPFPWRAEEGGLRDAFAQDAWQALTREPARPFARIEEIDGREYYRYATADMMRATCVECHNNHELSPKRDWRVGEVRGVLEIAIPMDKTAALAASGFWWSVVLLAVFGGLGAVSVGTIIGHLRRGSNLLEQRVQRRTAELDYERYLLYSLMDSMPDNIYFKDAEGHYLRINRAKAKRSGLESPEQGIGKTDFDFFPKEHARAAMADERRVMETGEPIVGKEERLVWPDGRVTWSSTTKVPLRDAQNRVVGTLGISRDITTLKQTAEELRSAKLTAEAASRAKGDFLANMSHEIRTPLNAVIGMTDLVLDTELTATQRDYLRIVRDAGESLLELINDILDFSKIEAGKLDLHPGPFDLREGLGDMLKTLALRAHAKGLELAAHFDPNVPQRVRADGNRLRQVLVNLVGNAIKFTERGEVVLDVTVEEDGPREILLRFSVRDTGPGIPPEHQQRIFEAFEQVDASTTRQFGGTGLGLAICARLAQLMGGHIWLESQLGVGSTFYFTARLEKMADATPREPRDKIQRLSGTPVLVVDDNDTNRVILKEMLANWGLRPVICGSAADALRELHAAAQTERPFPLVVSDVNMPFMDGFGLVETLRLERKLAQTRVILLTSADRTGHVERCQQLGINEYLVKPVKQSELLNAVAAALEIEGPEAAARESTAPSEPSPPIRSLKILLAEDSPTNQKVALGVLKKLGHRVTAVVNGRDAVDAVRRGQFDVVLMDVQMPIMDGIQATAAIRAHESETGGHVPIVAMTAHAMQGDRAKCLNAGMDDYIAKPIRIAMVEDVLRRMFETPESPAASPAGASQLDFAAAREALGDDDSLLRDVLREAVEELPRLCAELDAAVERGETQAVRRAAHTLGGTVRLFGTTEIARYAWEIEEGASRDDLTAAAARLPSLREAADGATEEMRSYLLNSHRL